MLPPDEYNRREGAADRRLRVLGVNHAEVLDWYKDNPRPPDFEGTVSEWAELEMPLPPKGLFRLIKGLLG